MIYIANPLYDCAFYFMMEDESASKALLSALLRSEVRDLKKLDVVRPSHKKHLISWFRLDFSLVMNLENGEEKRVKVILRKTWLNKGKSQSRQYLGAQYFKNPYKEDAPEEDGLPIISIYILGHKLGDLREPVVYVRRRYLDYESQEITDGVPDPFIESLTHDSIIVQIPYLQGRARNHLERLLSVFDQDCRTAADEHLLQIDEEGMGQDGRLLVNRLVMAAASPKVRRDMQVEDEILSEIEMRDTTIMMKDKEIEQKDQVIEQQKNILRSTAANLSSRGLSSREIATILAVSEETVSALLRET